MRRSRGMERRRIGIESWNIKEFVTKKKKERKENKKKENRWRQGGRNERTRGRLDLNRRTKEPTESGDVERLSAFHGRSSFFSLFLKRKIKKNKKKRQKNIITNERTRTYN